MLTRMPSASLIPRTEPVLVAQTAAHGATSPDFDSELDRADREAEALAARQAEEEAKEKKAVADVRALENLVTSVAGRTPGDPVEPGLADLATGAFDAIDADNDDVLSVEEIADTRNRLIAMEAATGLEGAITFSDMLLRLDLNADGAVSKAEFSRALLSGAAEKGPTQRDPMTLAAALFQPEGGPGHDGGVNPRLPPETSTRQDAPAT